MKRRLKEGRRWNTRYVSSLGMSTNHPAQYDFLFDMGSKSGQCNDVSGNTELADGTAEKWRWTVLVEEKDGKAAIAVKRRNLNLLRDSRKSTRWILVVLGGILFPHDVLAAHLERRRNFGTVLQNGEGHWQEHARGQAGIPDLWNHCWNECAGGGEAEPGTVCG